MMAFAVYAGILMVKTREFTQIFGMDPRQSTTEGHQQVQKHVTKKTLELWCAHAYVQKQHWDNDTHLELHTADRATRLAEKFGYKPWTPGQFTFQEDPFASCPAPP